MPIVGACFACHKEDSKVMKGRLNNIEQLEKKSSGKFVIPYWN